MEVRINKNWNKQTNEDLFGLSIKVDGSRYYCKYPIGFQSYTSRDNANIAKQNLTNKLNQGAEIIYPELGSKGLNKVECIMIKGIRIGFVLSFEYCLPEDDFNERFYSFLDKHELNCYGGNLSFAITKLIGTVTIEERKMVFDWLENEPSVTNVRIHNWFALNVEE